MKKLGRPTKAARDRLEVVFRLRMTREEYRRLCAAAKEQGLNVSEYARKKIIGR
jgi:mobilization protein NikA